MKKTLITLFITLIFTNSAIAISKGQWNTLYKNCYSQKDGMTTKFWKAYGKCNANKYDANFSEQDAVTPSAHFDDEQCCALVSCATAL